MRLTELKVHGFRAFPPEEQTFQFNGDNVAVVGDNGTGKSSILAAVEFLLSGSLTHLSGEGTGSLNLSDHAPHQDATEDECYVEGRFETEDGDTGTVRRFASDSSELVQVDGDIDTDDVDVSQWNDDHLILTRGELLQFVEATPRNRGEELSNLLNLRGVRNRTEGFSQIKETVEQREDEMAEECRRIASDIGSSLGLNVGFPIHEDHRASIVEEVNERLDILQADNISSLSEFDDAMETIDLEVSGEVQDPLYQTATGDRVESLLADLEEFDDLEERFQELSAKQDEILSYNLDELDQLDLFRTADRLVDSGTQDCPLCGEHHSEDYLQTRIQRRLETLSELENLRDKTETLRVELLSAIRSIEEESVELVDELYNGLDVGDHDEIEEDVDRLSEFIDNISSIRSRIETPLIQHDEEDELLIREFSVEDVTFDISGTRSSLDSTMDYIGDLEPRGEYTEAHADLVRVRDSIAKLRSQEPELEELRELESELETVVSLFSEARKETLDELYSSIEDNFNQYYTTINPDEEEIDLSLDYDGADSVDIEAQHGDRRDTPLAFHSEGHLDTMGICLFLALREELDTSATDIVLLDDIVMSIDKNHRRGVARLLADYFDDGTQAILATHDEVWADQLRERGIIPRDNVIEIADWELSTGPVMSWGNWGLIEERLDDGDPHGAAAHLRRTAEKVGRILAMRLKVEMEFKSRYSLGDYIHAINSKIDNTASKTKGQHSDGTEIWEKAKEIDDARSDILGDAPLNELNRMIHYNREEWGQLGAEDLRGVLNHWKDIDELMTCDSCGSWLSYSRDGDHRWIHCECRNIQFGYEK